MNSTGKTRGQVSKSFKSGTVIKSKVRTKKTDIVTKEDKFANERTSIRIYIFGPGVGECIVVRFPDNEWGVVDCYIHPRSKGENVISFLERHGVERLAFFCLTHPHSDHFTGADLLLDRYKGRIDRLWRYGGLSRADLQQRATLAARVKAKRKGDPEAIQQANDFTKVLAALREAGQGLPDANNRRIIAPLDLYQTAYCTITAIRPGLPMIEAIEDRILSRSATEGYLIFDEDEGSLVNSLSVVLLIRFGDAHILLLGDAEGPCEIIPGINPGVSLLKVAHHGSCNGYGSNWIIECTSGMASGLAITPYSRSRLPRSEMKAKYQAATQNFFCTEETEQKRPKTVLPTVTNARLAHGNSLWHGIEVLPNGLVQSCPC